MVEKTLCHFYYTTVCDINQEVGLYLGEIHLAAQVRRCTVATKDFFRPCWRSVEEIQVAATRKISLYPPQAAVDFSPSRAATRRSNSNLSSPTKKGHRAVSFLYVFLVGK